VSPSWCIILSTNIAECISNSPVVLGSHLSNSYIIKYPVTVHISTTMLPGVYICAISLVNLALHKVYLVCEVHAALVSFNLKFIFFPRPIYFKIWFAWQNFPHSGFYPFRPSVSSLPSYVLSIIVSSRFNLRVGRWNDILYVGLSISQCIVGRCLSNLIHSLYDLPMCTSGFKLMYPLIKFFIFLSNYFSCYWRSLPGPFIF
jgi:hypothetical protein